jgi:Cu-processing system ATP-binding protein
MVSVRDVRKRFGPLEVLKGVTADFASGTVTAVVGPNASGKTTLMKCVLGLVLPDAGEITVDGETTLRNPATRAKIGYMPQKAQFPDNLKAKELFAWVQDLRGAKGPRLANLIEQFQLEPHLQKSLRVLSGGSRQKVSAVLTFLFDPPVLILDEPSAGLDPLASSRLKDVILEEKRRGKTIILTSHVMSELEELTDEIVFLLEGDVVFRGTLDALRERTGQPKLERAVAQLMAGASA